MKLEVRSLQKRKRITVIFKSFLAKSLKSQKSL